MTTDALNSLYGQGHLDATRTRECVAMPGKREQTVFTPQVIVDVLLKLWGSIEYDCCHGEPGVVLTATGREAKKAKRLPPDQAMQVALGFAVQVESIVPARRRTSTRGLIDPWPRHSYANPPYGTLAEWLDWSLKQFEPHVMLVPVRPHRKWWRKWARERQIIYLNPLTFLGYDGSFPAPLCLASNRASAELVNICRDAGIGEPL